MPSWPTRAGVVRALSFITVTRYPAAALLSLSRITFPRTVAAAWAAAVDRASSTVHAARFLSRFMGAVPRSAPSASWAALLHWADTAVPDGAAPPAPDRCAVRCASL